MIRLVGIIALLAMIAVGQVSEKSSKRISVRDLRRHEKVVAQAVKSTSDGCYDPLWVVPPPKGSDLQLVMVFRGLIIRGSMDDHFMVVNSWGDIIWYKLVPFVGAYQGFYYPVKVAYWSSIPATCQ